MVAYIVRRLLLMPVLVLCIISISFVISHSSRGNPLSSVLSERQLSNPEAVAAAKARWGLDKSLPEQYVVYLSNLAHGDFGTSFQTKRPVRVDIQERLPATLELVLCAMLVASISGITLGVLAAKFRDSVIDHIARGVALMGASLPVFWSGLIGLYFFSIYFKVLPGPGRLDARATPPEFVTGFFTVDTLIAGDFAKFGQVVWHLILPSIVLGWAVMGIISRMVRASMLEVLTKDYILMARSKGASQMRVLLKHALLNALIPTITIIGFSFASLITGAVLTETIFSWPGIGSYAVGSARALDYPAIMGVTMVGGMAFLLANLITDIAYVKADPKMRLV
ncbi:ABC transporter permease [Agrobacterium sp. T29]|uniref:ABC transporter permease n=1 Tax=Agrobacterium sp. T29 TaxID=2580515 RepID=UPI00115CA16F|nr:ABC transporter permease [Agrobacterium sp. T29]